MSAYFSVISVLRFSTLGADCSKGRRSHGLDVADGQHRVAVTGEDDLALLGELEAAL